MGWGGDWKIQNGVGGTELCEEEHEWQGRQKKEGFKKWMLPVEAIKPTMTMSLKPN